MRETTDSADLGTPQGGKEEWGQPGIERSFLAAAFDDSGDAVIGINIQTGCITHWNLGAKRLYGWSAEEITGQHFTVLVPADKRAEWQTNMTRLSELSVPSVLLDTVRLHKDGLRVNVSVRVGVVRDPHSGEALGLCSIARDITSRIEAQDQDRKIALALQRPMLFRPQEDAFAGLSVHTAYAMASDEALVGGDFWDTFAFNNEHVALVIGDVLGHGLHSAVFTSELRFTMRAYIREHIEPSKVLYHMNEFLCQSNRLFQEGLNSEGSDAPVCITLAVIIRETGEGVLAVAGMEGPMIVRANGVVEPTVAGGLPLGIYANEEYAQTAFRLGPGDTLLLTTDGITEARQGRRFLESEGLARLATQGSHGTVTQMADTILNGARDFANGKLHDDASVVLVRRTAGPA
jgi:PAS domain S-box-containing protein